MVGGNKELENVCGLPVNQHRRDFLRSAIGFAGGSTFGALAGCARAGESLDDAGDISDGDGSTADLGLRSGIEIGLGSTAIAGLASRSGVDPDSPGGGRLVTIDAVEPGEEVSLSWRRTVEREMSPTGTRTGGDVGEPTPTSEVELVEETGTITASGLADAHEPFLPMYWRPGEIHTDTSAIWLSREAFRELKGTGKTAWSRDVLTRISRIGVEAAEQLGSGVAEEVRNGVAEVDEVFLRAESGSVDLDLTVNGETVAVSTIEAFDSFGNAYRILDNERNPLVAKFTYDAVSVGFTGFDTALWTLIKTVFSGYQVLSVEMP